MRTQPNKNYKSNDIIMTPEYLTKFIVNYFKPTGKLLEPCKGTGNFLKYMPSADYCEISENKDFLLYNKQVDWIITNPPWSKVREFLLKSMSLSDNIVFLVTVNHLWTKARLRDMKQYEFAIKEICLLPEKTKDFPQTGFILGVIHLQKGYIGDIKLTDWRDIKFNENLT